MYLHVGTKMQYRYFIVATLLQIPLWVGFGAAVSFLKSHFHVQEVSTSSGVRTAGAATLILVIASYSLFVRLLRGEGQESFRLRNELELARGIQKTLVPPVTMRTKTFEIYGRSDPSEKVGGDLVDVVQLEDGSMVAYLADIAGHGLQAGILMGWISTEQFPLGLLPVPGFSAAQTKVDPGDLLVVATDGILEACNRAESEFGPDRLQQVISDHVPESLPALTERILATVRAFGKQVDDQTLLLIRRLPPDKGQFSHVGGIHRWRIN
jgi:serine phosphatase RsbU (regulator of sigma subunit)